MPMQNIVERKSVQLTELLRLSALIFSGITLLSACGGSGSDNADNQGNSVKPDVEVPTTPEPELSWRFNRLLSTTKLEHEWGIVNPTENSMAESFAGGIAAGDYDNDGLIDLYIDAGNLQPSKLFKNMGGNRFIETAKAAGVQLVNHKGSGPTFADVNGDGWLDLFIGGIEGDSNYLFINNQDGTFIDKYNESGLKISAKNTVSAAFADYDKDGDLDMALSHWGNPFSQDTDHMWKNNGDGTFVADSVASQIAQQILVSGNGLAVEGDKDYTFTPNFADLNNDGWPDLTFSADFFTSKFFINNQQGEFVDHTTNVISDENGMGSAIADYDNDGDLDWFVTAIYEVWDTGQVKSPGNRFYENKGDGSFKDSTLKTRTDRGGWGWGACFADFNNDGILDLLHTNGWADDMPYNRDVNHSNDKTRLFIGSESGRFSEEADTFLITDTGQGRGVVCFDSDLDGDIDVIVVSNDEDTNSFAFYENEGANKLGHYLQVKLTDNTNSNRQAIGARIYVTTNDGVTQMRELQQGSNFASQNPVMTHFGLAEHEEVTQIKIVWPDGETVIEQNVKVNQLLHYQR